MNHKDCYNFMKGFVLGGSLGGVIGYLILGAQFLPLMIPVFLAALFVVYWALTLEVRYQKADHTTRFIRNLVYQPKHFIRFGWWVFCWLISGAKPFSWPANDNFPEFTMTRRESMLHSGTMSKSMADFDMQRYQTAAEILAELRVDLNTTEIT
jgi:hypothetical protein